MSCHISLTSEKENSLAKFFVNLYGSSKLKHHQSQLPKFRTQDIIDVIIIATYSYDIN
jgi:hypothetical protein